MFIMKIYFKNKKGGFTLIELLVVVAIISLLSSIVFASLSSARVQAKDSAAITFGNSIASIIASCDFDGGKIVAPDPPSFPTNNICNLGSNYGKWPKAPDGWNWGGVYNNTSANYVRIYPSYGDSKYSSMFCGINPNWSPYCSRPSYPGICRLSTTFACARRLKTVNYWE